MLSSILKKQNSILLIIDRQVVGIQGYITKDKEIMDFNIFRIERKDMEELKDFADDEITFHVRDIGNSLLSKVYVTDFYGMIDVTLCKDLPKCDEYIKDIVMKNYCEYKNEK